MAGKSKRGNWTAVACNTHGRRAGDVSIPPELRIGSVGTRKARQGILGCPECAKERTKK